MRCGCPQCVAFMVQAEVGASVCVCPDCGYRCNACLGTGTALSREEVLARLGHDWYVPKEAQNDEDTNDGQG